MISSLEHNSIVSAALTLEEKGFEIEIIPVNKNGLVDIDTLKELVRDDTILASICAVDSEIGLKQPVEEIALFLKKYPNCFFHTDAAQAIGKVNIDYSNIDLVTITPHKFYGMNGIGMLIKKRGASLKSQINGGASTTIYRSGTPVIGLIASLYQALSLALNNIKKRETYIKSLSDYIKTELSKYQGVTINNTSASIPDTINFSVKKIPSLTVQEYLNKHDIYVSTKTSCCPIETPSKLVYALTKDKSLSSTSIRLSLSYLNTKEEIDEFLRVFDIMYKEYEVNGKI